MQPSIHSRQTNNYIHAKSIKVESSENPTIEIKAIKSTKKTQEIKTVIGSDEKEDSVLTTWDGTRLSNSIELNRGETTIPISLISVNGPTLDISMGLFPKFNNVSYYNTANVLPICQDDNGLLCKRLDSEINYTNDGSYNFDLSGILNYQTIYWMDKPPISLNYHLGLSADSLDREGLPEAVVYDDIGTPVGVNYEIMTCALLQMVQSLTIIVNEILNPQNLTLAKKTPQVLTQKKIIKTNKKECTQHLEEEQRKNKEQEKEIQLEEIKPTKMKKKK